MNTLDLSLGEDTWKFVMDRKKELTYNINDGTTLSPLQRLQVVLCEENKSQNCSIQARIAEPVLSSMPQGKLVSAAGGAQSKTHIRLKGQSKTRKVRKDQQGRCFVLMDGAPVLLKSIKGKYTYV